MVYFVILFMLSIVTFGAIIITKQYLDRRDSNEAMRAWDLHMRITYESKSFDDCGYYSPVDNDNNHVWPWHVKIYYDGVGDGARYISTCGGTLVSSRSIITHYKCISQVKNEWKKYLLVLGKFDDDWKNMGEHEQRITIEDVKNNKVTNAKEALAAIALVRVRKNSIKFGYFVRPVCLSLNKSHDDTKVVTNAYGIVPIYIPTNRIPGIFNQLYAVIQLHKCCYIYGGRRGWSQLPPEIFCGRSVNSVQNRTFELCSYDLGSGVAFPESYKDKTRYFLRGVFTSTVEHNCNKDVELMRLTGDATRELLLLKNEWYH